MYTRKYILYVCVCLYIHNTSTQYIYILCKQKQMLDAINRLTALVFCLFGHINNINNK